MRNELKTILYCRSAAPNDEAIEWQEKMLRDYANEHGYNNISVYADNGFSGMNFNRPAFARMVEDIKAGAVGAVLAKDTSRISRNMFALHDWLNGVQREGVLFVSVIDGVDSNSIADTHSEMIRLFEEYCAKQRKRPRRNSVISTT